MNRLSSNFTLMLKIFFPIFWIVFFGLFIVASFVTNPIEAPQIANDKFRLQSIIFVLSGILFFVFTFFRLKRVDGDDSGIYISNYFKTYKYTFESIEKIVIYNHVILKAAHLKFIGKSTFGKKIIFLPYLINLKEYAEKYDIILVNYGEETTTPH